MITREVGNDDLEQFLKSEHREVIKIKWREDLNKFVIWLKLTQEDLRQI